jgi:hypothetical protein
VASQVGHSLLAAGLNDGRVWLADPAAQGLNMLKAEKGSPIVALAMSRDATRAAWADEDGNAGVVVI